MKVSDYWKDHYEFSGKASDISRQLGFAGIGVIWVFKVSVGSTVSLSVSLICPLLLIVLSLCVDLTQYVWASLVWRHVARAAEKRGKKSDDDAGRHSLYLERSITWLWFAKVLLMIGAYALLIYALAWRVSTS